MRSSKSAAFAAARSASAASSRSAALAASSAGTSSIGTSSLDTGSTFGAAAKSIVGGLPPRAAVQVVEDLLTVQEGDGLHARRRRRLHVQTGIDRLLLLREAEQPAHRMEFARARLVRRRRILREARLPEDDVLAVDDDLALGGGELAEERQGSLNDIVELRERDDDEEPERCCWFGAASGLTKDLT